MLMCMEKKKYLFFYYEDKFIKNTLRYFLMLYNCVYFFTSKIHFWTLIHTPL